MRSREVLLGPNIRHQMLQARCNFFLTLNNTLKFNQLFKTWLKGHFREHRQAVVV